MPWRSVRSRPSPGLRCGGEGWGSGPARFRLIKGQHARKVPDEPRVHRCLFYSFLFIWKAYAI